jgi:hypothetical protein
MSLFCKPTMVSNYATELITQYERLEQLNVENIKNGIIFPLELSETNIHEQNQYGGVCNENLQFVELSLTKRVSPPNFDSGFVDWYKGANPKYNKSEFKYVDETVVFIGALPKHFGHFILEGLSRLWFLLESNNLEIYRCVFISDDETDNFSEFLRLFGLPKERIFRIAKPTIFNEIIVPEQSIRLHDFYTKKYKDTIDKILMNVQPEVNAKVFFSKKERANDRSIGEGPIEKVFASNGYEVYYPENMSVGKMLSVMKGCTLFVASSGTNIHNSIFLQDGSTAVCLNRSEHFHPVQTMIARMRKLNQIYIDSFLFGRGTNWSSGPFFLFPTQYLLSFFNVNNIHFKYFSLFKKYPFYTLFFIVRAARRSLINILYPVYQIMKLNRVSLIDRIALIFQKVLVRN